MRILHVIPAVAERYGGPSSVALDTCAGLAARGHNVLLATTDADGPGRLDVSIGQPTTYRGVPAIVFPRTSSEAFKWSPDLARWLDRSVAGFDVVDIHAIFSHSSLVAGRACRQMDVPYVVRPHGSLDPWSLARKATQKRILFWLGARRLLTGAARVQYTTGDEQRLAESRLPWLANGVVVPLGVGGEQASAPARPTGSGAPYVLTLSRLESKKGLELLIAAFHQVTVAGALADWRLVIAGDGDTAYVRDLKRLAANGSAAARIDFPGWVSGVEKAALLRRAALFASPSEQENFGVAVVEAMAEGVPVLVSPGVNLAPDIAAAGAGWIAERNPASFPRVLEAILHDRPARTTRGLAAQELARQFSWDRSLDALIALYEAVRRPGRGGLAA
jgi:glycosyltransferase involved in cell wall biosynthesis